MSKPLDDVTGRSERALNRFNPITDDELLIKETYEDLLSYTKQLEQSQYECVGWLITYSNGGSEVCMGTLTDAYELLEGDEAVPLFIKPKPPTI